MAPLDVPIRRTAARALLMAALCSAIVWSKLDGPRRMKAGLTPLSHAEDMYTNIIGRREAQFDHKFPTRSPARQTQRPAP